MKKLKWIFGVVLIALVVTAYLNYPKLNLISGYASKNMASNVFIAHRDPVDINLYDHDMPLIDLAQSEVSQKDKAATASVYGLMKRKSVYKDGLGAVLTNDEFSRHNFTIIPHRTPIKNDTLPFPYGNKGVKNTLLENVDYAKLEVALTNAFKNPEERTRTLLVVHKNQIIGERYIRGFSKDTPILGWSMTKSVLATLYGILEYQGKMNVNAAAPVPEWQNDERKNITINHLLRMQSGLAWDEDYFKISDVTRMLFLASDMTQVQKEKELVAQPAELWNYSSGTTNLLSGILRDQFKNHQAYLDFPYAELFDKIGMQSMLLETDLQGNYVGSSYGWATTRDWAKLGVLYLNKGDWNGQRIFSESWVDYITKPTQGSNGTYGAHFWLNADGKYPDIPRDLFSLNGFQGQRVFIIPSKDLIVVRTGLEEQTDEQFNTLLSGILKAID